MTSYLHIAKQVLQCARVPMTAKEMLCLAFSMNVVPPHLYGKTQHKTLQARLSEDICLRQSESEFFRVSPGRFFLRALSSDMPLPFGSVQDVTARRRGPDLDGYTGVFISKNDLFAAGIRGAARDAAPLYYLHDDARFRCLTASCGRADRTLKQLATFVVVKKGTSLLAHRKGKYQVTDFHSCGQLALGFLAPLRPEDADMFDRTPFGLINRGIMALTENVGLEAYLAAEALHKGTMRVSGLINADVEEESRRYCAAIVVYLCPDKFEPTKNKLGINDLHWMNIAQRPIQAGGFDIWSKFILDGDHPGSALLESDFGNCLGRSS